MMFIVYRIVMEYRVYGVFENITLSVVRWCSTCTLAISALRRLRQVDYHGFEVSLNDIGRPCLGEQGLKPESTVNKVLH